MMSNFGQLNDMSNIKPEIEIINSAIQQYNPIKVFALFSGGNDSICATHIASHANQFDGAVFIDTGIKIQQALDHAIEVCDKFKWELRVVKTPKSYEDIVMKWGFPGASSHRYMYIWLKERAIDKLFREVKTNRAQKILLVTGVRRHESRRRMENVVSSTVKQGSRIWVAPMWDWTDEIKQSYMQDNGLPENPIKKIMHVSGDCLCGAYNDKGDLEILKTFFPKEGTIVEELQGRVMKKFPWGGMICHPSGGWRTKEGNC